jgi:hypothetical protein
MDTGRLTGFSGRQDNRLDARTDTRLANSIGAASRPKTQNQPGEALTAPGGPNASKTAAGRPAWAKRAEAAQNLTSQLNDLMTTLIDGLKLNAKRPEALLADKRLLSAGSSSLRDIMESAQTNGGVLSPNPAPRMAQAAQAYGVAPSEPASLRVTLQAITNVIGGPAGTVARIEDAANTPGFDRNALAESLRLDQSTLRDIQSRLGEVLTTQNAALDLSA